MPRSCGVQIAKHGKHSLLQKCKSPHLRKSPGQSPGFASEASYSSKVEVGELLQRRREDHLPLHSSQGTRLPELRKQLKWQVGETVPVWLLWLWDMGLTRHG